MNTDRTECRAVSDLLVALAAGELEHEHTAQLQAHLADCAACDAEFAVINRAVVLSTSLKLPSPEIDRYPEFLRCLAASETHVPVKPEAQALTPTERGINPSVQDTAQNEAGVAAVIPLFGNRIALRNGFGQGFELRVTSSQGNQWLHLSANSLTRVAAVAAGVSLAAGISVVALLLLVFPFFRHAQTEPQNPVRDAQPERPPNPGPNLPPRGLDEPAWIQTASNAERTLAIWKENAQLYFGWIERSDLSLSNRYSLQTPLISNRPPLPPRMAECAIATDGKDFILLREIEGAIYLWRLEAPTSEPEKNVVLSPPTLLSRKGAQPGIAWVGDRYVAVWVSPDMIAPAIELIELGRDGRVLQASAAIIAATEGGGKVGLPGVTGGNGQVLVSYFVQGGVLMTRRLIRAEKGYELSLPVNIGEAEGPHHLPVRLFALPDGYLACWDVMNAESAEIRLARLDRQGQLLRRRVLVRARTPITSYDLKFTAEGTEELLLLWSEAQPGGALTFTQNFSFSGEPAQPPQNLFVTGSKPAAVALGDVANQSLVWIEPTPSGHPSLGIKAIRKP